MTLGVARLRTLRRALLPALGIALAAASPADAHLMNTGFGPFYDGLLHLFVTPEDLLPVVAIALLGGLGGPRLGRTVLFVLPAVWLLGVGAGFLLGVPRGSPIVAAAVTALLGALVAVGRALPVSVVAASRSGSASCTAARTGSSWRRRTRARRAPWASRPRSSSSCHSSPGRW